ncbi:autophagy-related protein 18g-like isoform X2 [Curcuma longa]|uniref:autophagy-related protein 18g-like isoform X2 n=1 Tax=Curcuma longa TaxID=136217 RepID=UPI003D9F974B
MMRRGKGRNGLLPSSLRIISSCLKTVSSNAGAVASTVCSAGASMAASMASAPDDEKEQVLWAGFDKLDTGSFSFKHVLLLGYSNGFQVLDVEDASHVSELVSKRDGPVTFLQMQPLPIKSGTIEGFRALHPLLLVVAGDETHGSGVVQGGRLSALIRENSDNHQSGSCVSTSTVVRFYSLKSHSYVHVLRFRSAVYIVRCSPRIVAVALAAQIYCFDAVTLENKFSVLTYPLQGIAGVSIGCGPMAVGPRWLAYACNSPLVPVTSRLSPQSHTPSPGVSPSSSPSRGNLVARYAMESGKTLAAGILNLGDKGCKTLSRYYQELLPDGSSSPLSTHSNEPDFAGMVVIKDLASKEVISQFRAHTSPISALCFDPSGTLLVTASIHGHNLNIFRIMPTREKNDSNLGSYDWTSSHFHLYKLSRGLTSAVIQDISFSHFSQWISVVSSRNTCHIYLISPFGGDATLRAQETPGERPVVVPSLTLPWWTSSCCLMHHQSKAPPPPNPITCSVVSRVKRNSSWLSIVNNVATSAAGKVPPSSGAIAAVFHNSQCCKTLKVPSKEDSLESLLIFSPSGYVIQHELLPSSLFKLCDSGSKAAPASLLQMQDEELCPEPVLWWDVCRRQNWAGKEEDISRVIFNNLPNSEKFMDSSEDNGTYSMPRTNTVSGTELGRSKSAQRHISNAEVQIRTGKIPIWQKSMISFCELSPSRIYKDLARDITGGEIEMEKFAFNEVEIRQKDLLPVLGQFDHSQSHRNVRVGDTYRTLSSGTFQAKNELNYNTIKGLHSGHLGSLPVMDDSLTNGALRMTSNLPRNGGLVDDYTSTFSESVKDPKTCRTDIGWEEDKLHNSHDCSMPTEAVTDANSKNSHCESTEEDMDSDAMMGGMFFSED